MMTISDIYVNYGAAEVLHGVSLSVPEKSLISLIGANGAGKTTLLMTISGIKKPTKGSIEYEANALQKMRPDQINALGISHCPEGRRVFPEMTVVENLELGALSNMENANNQMQKCFDFFPRLYERRLQLAGTLSGGEQQMLAIGRALMSNPKIIMFDEPSLGLAPNIVEQVTEIIVELNKHGITVLLVEQNAYMAMNISSYTYVLETGKVAMEGESSKLINDDHIRKAYLGI